MRVVVFLFYAALALLYFGIGFPYLEIIIGLCALILAVSALR